MLTYLLDIYAIMKAKRRQMNYQKPYYGNTRYTLRILKCDEAYIETISLALSGYTGKKRKKILSEFYVKFEAHCPFCQNKGKEAAPSDRKAALIPTEAGYIFTCLNDGCPVKCVTLNQFLGALGYEQIRQSHCFDRWQKKLAGQGFNCPAPSQSVRRDAYKDQQRQLKNANAAAYQRKP